MTRNISIASALALSLLLMPACSKDKKEGEESAKVTDTAGDQGGDTKAAPGEDKAKGDPTPGATRAMADVLAHMPADTEVLVSFSLTSLTDTPLWKQFGPAAIAAASKELGEVKTACGFDPLSRLQSVHLGINSENSEQPVLIVRGFERTEMTKCFSALAEKKGEKIEIVEEGKLTTVSSAKEGKTQAIAWLDDESMLLVPKQSDKEYLQARLAGKDGLGDSVAFAAIAGKANQAAPIWFVANLRDGSPATQQLGAMGKAPTGIYGSVGFDSGLQFDLGLVFAAPADAQAALTMAKSALPMAKPMLGPSAGLLDKLLMATDGSDMTVKLNLTDADLESLTSLAGGAMGMGQ